MFIVVCLVCAGDVVYDWGNFNVSTYMSFALYSDNLHLPVAAHRNRPGWGWLGGGLRGGLGQ